MQEKKAIARGVNGLTFNDVSGGDNGSMWSTEIEKVPTASLKISSGLDSSTETDLDGRAEIHVKIIYKNNPLYQKYKTFTHIFVFKNRWPYNSLNDIKQVK